MTTRDSSTSCDDVTELLRRPAAEPSLWCLDPSIAYLNHGSFGSCPRHVLNFQNELRLRLEREPVQFLVRELEPLLDSARAALAKFVGAPPDHLVPIPNATTGVNTVLRSLHFEPTDEILVTDQEYNACRNALEFAVSRSGARVRVAHLPFPLQSPEEIVEGVLAAVTPQTRLVLLDHVTSQTGLILPLERIVPELRERGVPTLIDGAHAPGMIPLQLEQLAPDYYTGNCHKWICGPKGAAFLYVSPERQRNIRPLAISHGANSPRSDRSRFLIEFGWPGTWDPTAFLSVPEALRYLESLLPGGWPQIMEHNRALVLAGRQLLQHALGIESPAPAEMIGALASLPIADGDGRPSGSPLYIDPLQELLWGEKKIEVPVAPWPAPPKRLLRISAQLYNFLPQYENLAAELKKIFGPGRASPNSPQPN